MPPKNPLLIGTSTNVSWSPSRVPTAPGTAAIRDAGFGSVIVFAAAQAAQAACAAHADASPYAQQCGQAGGFVASAVLSVVTGLAIGAWTWIRKKLAGSEAEEKGAAAA